MTARLRVHWLDAPALSETHVRGESGGDVSWWCDPATGEFVLGGGVAVDLSAEGACGLAPLAEGLRSLHVDATGDVAHGGAVMLGCGPFDPARAAGAVWGDSPAARWVVPEAAFVVRGGAARCAVAGPVGFQAT